jgi:hypothetical protein
MKNLIRKILREETAEEYSFYQLTNNKDPETMDLLNKIESPDSEDGKGWSNTERGTLSKFLKNKNVKGYEPIKDSTVKNNEVKVLKSNAETLINKVDSLMNSSIHKPKNSECYNKLNKLSDKLSLMVDGDLNDEDLGGRNTTIPIIKKIMRNISTVINKCNFKH